MSQPWQPGDYYQQASQPVSGYPGYPVPYVQPVFAPGQMFQPVRTSGMAVASLVLSIVGLVFGCCSFGVPSLLAVIFGHFALVETRDGGKAGRGMAVAGLVMGYVFVVPCVLISFWFILAGGLAGMQEPT